MHPLTLSLSLSIVLRFSEMNVDLWWVVQLSEEGNKDKQEADMLIRDTSFIRRTNLQTLEDRGTVISKVYYSAGNFMPLLLHYNSIFPPLINSQDKFLPLHSYLRSEKRTCS